MKWAKLIEKFLVLTNLQASRNAKILINFIIAKQQHLNEAIANFAKLFSVKFLNFQVLNRKYSS